MIDIRYYHFLILLSVALSGVDVRMGSKCHAICQVKSLDRGEKWDGVYMYWSYQLKDTLACWSL